MKQNQDIKNPVVLKVCGCKNGNHGPYMIAVPIGDLPGMEHTEETVWVTFDEKFWTHGPLPEKGEWVVGSRLRKKGTTPRYGWRVLEVRPYKPSDEVLLRKEVVA